MLIEFLADAESYTGAVISVKATLLLVVAAIAGIIEARIVPGRLIPALVPALVPGLLLGVIGIIPTVIAHISEEGQAAVIVDQATAIAVTHAVYQGFSCKDSSQKLNSGSDDISVYVSESITYIGERSTATIIAVISNFAVTVIVIDRTIDTTIVYATVAKTATLTIIIVFPVIAVLLPKLLHLTGPAISPGLGLEGRLISHIAVSTIADPIAIAATYIEIVDMADVNDSVAVLNSYVVYGATVLISLIDVTVGHVYQRWNIVPVNGEVIGIAFVALTACFPSHNRGFSNRLRYTSGTPLLPMYL